MSPAAHTGEVPTGTPVVTVGGVFSIGISPASGRSDRELLAAHVAGDRYAFEELFRRHRSRLRRVARAGCHNAQDADDVLQDAMLKAHRNAGAFLHQAAVSSWLHRIVVNACIDRLRRATSHPTVELVVAAHPVPDRTGQVETAIMVRSALSGLPAEQRAAVMTVDMHGYSIAEAARLLGIPEGTVKSRCARARARLATALLHPETAEPRRP